MPTDMERSPIIPQRARPGDTVAIISPSGPGVAWWPHRADLGRTYLESLGLRVRLMPNSGGDEGWVAASAEACAEDIHHAFLDEQIKVILASTGGNHSNRLLPHLDYELIRSHPKIFQGYSDITVLLWALLGRAGLRTFHGPVLAIELAEYPRVLPYTDRYLRAAWFGDEPIRFDAAESWTDQFIPWDGKADLTSPRELRPSSGWVSLRGGVAEGPLLGGAIEAICWHLKGSATWLDPTGAILFLETSRETPSPAHVDAYLTDLEQLGVFANAAGLIFGRPIDYDEPNVEVLWEVVARRTEAAGLPVLANVDIGHADPMLTLPLGTPARLDTNSRRFELLERATGDRPAPAPRAQAGEPASS